MVPFSPSLCEGWAPLVSPFSRSDVAHSGLSALSLTQLSKLRSAWCVSLSLAIVLFGPLGLSLSEAFVHVLSHRHFTAGTGSLLTVLLFASTIFRFKPSSPTTTRGTALKVPDANSLPGYHDASGHEATHPEALRRVATCSSNLFTNHGIYPWNHVSLPGGSRDEEWQARGARLLDFAWTGG